MVLRRLMGWEMIDMTYERMMETKAGGKRWDGKELKDVPHWQDLPEWVSGGGVRDLALTLMGGTGSRSRGGSALAAVIAVRASPAQRSSIAALVVG